MSSFTIRAAVGEDVPAIEGCVEAAYEMYVERIGKRPAPMLDDYAALVEQGRVWVAQVEGGPDLLGLIVCWPVESHLYIDNIATSPAARGTGVGAALLSHAEDVAGAAGVNELQLYTNVAMVENHDYYLKRGFVETYREEQDGYDRIFYAKKC